MLTGSKSVVTLSPTYVYGRWGGGVIDWQDTQGTLGINRTTPCLDILMVKVVTKVYILNRSLSTSETF